MRQHPKALALLFAAMLASAVASASDIPHLRKQGSATQLIVDGKPFLVLGGEFGNSTTSSLDYLEPHWKTLKAMHLNTVLAPVSWELIEPVEGRFDFSLVDGIVRRARESGLRLVLLWFGSYKNSMSSYVPAWVKRDVDPWVPEREQITPSHGGLIVQTGPGEYYFAGSGLTITASPASGGRQSAGIQSPWEGHFENGNWRGGRLMNGDQTHQGRHIRLELIASVFKKLRSTVTSRLMTQQW